MNPKEKANEIYSWLMGAVSDVAQAELYPSEDWTEIENKADDLFNDKGTIQDLIGGQIFDAVGNISKNKTQTFQLCEQLKRIGHKELVEAVDDLIKKWEIKI